VAFAPNGATLASGDDDGSVRLWDVATGRHNGTLAGHAGTAGTVAFAPNGATLASGGDDGLLRLWDVATGQPTATCTGHVGPVRAVAFTPDGAAMATVGDDGSVRLWESATHSLIAILVATQKGGWAVVLPDGRYKISGSDPRAVMWWAVKLRRFEIDELDGAGPTRRRLESHEPIPALGHLPRHSDPTDGTCR
jgi:WD40 repeat protein